MKKGVRKAFLILRSKSFERRTKARNKPKPMSLQPLSASRAAYVFDISQTDGQELPDIGSVSGDPREYRERLGKFVTDQGILLEYSQDIAPARAALPQEARSRCCLDRPLLKNSQR